MKNNRMIQEVSERHVNAFGVYVRVRIAAQEGAAPGYADYLINKLTSAWNDSSLPMDPGPVSPLVDLGTVSDSNFERIHSVMSTKVTLAALEYNAGRMFMFHAGGIAGDDGRVALITGPSGRGKTTTLRQLGLHYGYVSDETIAIDLHGVVHPYRKPLSVITEGHKNKLQILPSDLGLRSLPALPLQLGGIAVLKRANEGVEESSVSNLGFAAGITALIEQSSYVMNIDYPLTRIAEMASSIGGFKLLTVGKPEGIHYVAKGLFISGSIPIWRTIMPNDGPETPFSPAYRPADVLDAVECEDGTVVLTRDSIAVHLTGIGPTLWRSACNGDSWMELITRLESKYGPSPENNTVEFVKQVAHELVSKGVLLPGLGLVGGAGVHE